MSKYRVLAGKHYVRVAPDKEVARVKGDIIELTEDVASRFANKFELVPESPPAEPESEPDKEDDEAPAKATAQQNARSPAKK